MTETVRESLSLVRYMAVYATTSTARALLAIIPCSLRLLTNTHTHTHTRTHARTHARTHTGTHTHTHTHRGTTVRHNKLCRGPEKPHRTVMSVRLPGA